MRIIELTGETKKNILNDLLKRSPNHYGEYEETVNDIIRQVRERGDEAVLPIRSSLINVGLRQKIWW